MSNGRLAGRVAVITGAGSGMGRASAVLFAREGAHVLVCDIDAGTAKESVGLAEDEGGSAEAVELDVADPAAIERVVTDLERRHGVLDVLFNHAGIPGPPEIAVDDAAWRRLIDINMRSGVEFTQRALPLLRKSTSGASVIFTSSTAGLAGSSMSPLYSLTKGGVVMFVKALSLKLAHENIRVNAICPGPVATNMTPEFFGRPRASASDDLVDQLAAGVPMGRTAQPEEIATAALFLASSDSSYVTGVALPVDGGYLAR